MRLRYLYFVLVVFTSIQCKDGIAYPCEDIKEGILYLDPDLAKPGINNMLADLLPVPDGDDVIGHEENLSVFIDRLKNECDLEASTGCYACIETFPLLSHVEIVLDSSGFSVTRSLDIETPENKEMTLRNIHQ